MTVVKYRNLYDTVGFQNQQIFERLYATKKFLCDEFIYGGHLLSLSASAVAVSAMILLDIPIRGEFLLIAYLSALFVYSYDHYKGMEVDSSNNVNRTKHLKKYHRFLPIILTGYGVGFFALLLYFGNFESFIFGGAFLLVGLLYTKKFKKLTKKILGFKNYYTSFSASLFLIFTAVYYSYSINLVLLILFAFLFLRLIINTSFCDIKDIDIDKKYHLLTFPVVLGKERFLMILHVINIISCLPIIVGVSLHLLPSFSLFILISSICSFYYIQKAKNAKTDIQSLSSVIVDGEFMFWPFLLAIGLIFTAF